MRIEQVGQKLRNVIRQIETIRDNTSHPYYNSFEDRYGTDVEWAKAMRYVGVCLFTHGLQILVR